ncbi:MAG: tetratricopeptide repeat protein [Acidobacteriota bacterium]
MRKHNTSSKSWMFARAGRRLSETLAVLILAAGIVCFEMPVALGQVVGTALEERYAYAYSEFQRGQYVAARKELLDLAAAYPKVPEIHNLLGVVCQKLGEVAKAAGHFESALQMAPDFAEARSNLALLYISQGRLQEALRLSYRNFGPAQIRFLSVTHHRQRKEFQKALDCALAVAEDFPNFPLAPLYAATELQQQGKLGTSEEYFRKVLQLTKDSAVTDAAQFGLGSNLAKQGRYAEARPLLEDLVRRNEGDVDARLELASLCLKTTEYERGRQLAQEVVSADPKDRRARLLLGNLLRRLGKDAEAEAHLQVLEGLVEQQATQQKGRLQAYTGKRD